MNTWNLGGKEAAESEELLKTVFKILAQELKRAEQSRTIYSSSDQSDLHGSSECDILQTLLYFFM